MPIKRTITVGLKLEILQAIDNRPEGVSIRNICQSFGVQSGQCARWRQDIERLKASKSGAKSVCQGPDSSIKVHEEDILAWIFEMRERSIGMENFARIRLYIFTSTYR